MSCDRTVLVETHFDDRLGKAEAASLERHLPACEECTSRLRALEALRDDVRALAGEIPPLAHQRARLALLRKAAEPAHAPRRRRAVWIGVALVFAPAAVFAARETMHAASSNEAPPPVMSAPAPASIEVKLPAKVVEAPVASASATPITPTADVEPAPRPRIVRRASTVASAPGPEPRPAPSTRAPASRDFADAMGSVSHGDFGAGAVKLERFTRDYPGDPRAEEALYLEAIALERAGRRDEARVVARRYLAEYPEGAHAAQAQRLSE